MTVCKHNRPPSECAFTPCVEPQEQEVKPATIADLQQAHHDKRLTHEMDNPFYYSFFS